MVSLVVGFPGSGKSYYAVKKIFDILSSSKTQNIQIIYTNIGGIKFDFFPDSKVQFKKLKENDLVEYLTECFKIYELHKNDENVDDYLIAYSKEKNFYNALIVFDECHDFFSSQDRIKIFWLTYHRHLNHEIILLTQNKSLINSKYRAIPELFIEAQPRSKKLFSSTLNYKHYASFAMRKSDLFNNSSIKTDPKIFQLYQSGNKSAQKSILLKFIAIFGFGIVVAGILFYNLLNSFSSNTSSLDENLSSLNDTTTHLPSDIQIPKNVKKNLSNNKAITMMVLYDSYEGYKIYNNFYKESYFKKFLRASRSKVLYKSNIITTSKYEVSKLVLKTTKEDIAKFFYIPQENIKTKRINRIEDTKR